MNRFPTPIVSPLLLWGLLFSSGCLTAGTADRPANPPSTQPVAETVARTMVLLVLSDNPPQHDADAAAELQRRHLAHIAFMVATGKVLVAGPFSERDDERLRGALIFNCSIDEARALANEDPAVKAGRLKVICMKWMTDRAAMTFAADSIVR